MPSSIATISTPSTPVNTEHIKLLEALVTFLTTGLGAGNNWTLLRNTTNGWTEDGDVYLRAPGPASSDNVFVNIQTESDIPNDAYSWTLQGAIGYNDSLVIVDPGQNQLWEQPGAIGEDKNPPRILFASEAIDYWFYANKSRFVVVANVSSQTVWESCYCGFINSYGTPTDFPVPLFIGGMDTVLGNPGVSATLDRHSWWLHQQDDINATTEPTAYFRAASGLWMPSNYENVNLSNGIADGLEETNRLYIYPYFFINDQHQVVQSEDPDLEYIKSNCRVVITEGASNNNPKAAQVGELDGVVFIPTFGAIGPNDILEELPGPINYRVFQNGTRTDQRSLMGVFED